MVKVSSIILPVVMVGSASAFAPAPATRAFVAKPLYAEAEAEPASADTPPNTPRDGAGTPPNTPRAEEVEESTGGALVPIKEETIEFTAGLIGGAVGFAVGGPILGAVAAAAANYASKTDQEIGEVMQNVSKTAIEIYNYLAGLDAKYEILGKTQKSLEDTLEKVKTSSNVDPEAVKKVEGALDSTNKKIKEINDEYDLVGAGNTALGVVGDLVEKAVKEAGKLNEEYKLSDKAMESVTTAVDKAKKIAK